MEKDNKQEDFVFSEAAISASFFAFENREFVEGHFNKLTVEMVKCANDEKFITNLRELKKRQRITRGITFQPEDFCFVNKIWFSIHKSTSNYYDTYSLIIGVNFELSAMCPFAKIQGRVYYGFIDKLIEAMKSNEFHEKWQKLLMENVYDNLFNGYNEIFK
ncbi:MAG: hypothetical protein LKF31_03005 [Muribaculaceae bacterium]|jgi:hypothetical protein|nr:hypothetical protein [Muribaculaceae bacterium]